MQRRKFIMALGGAVASAPFAARAQQATGRLYKIGYLGPASRELHLTKAFEDGLRSLGYRIGENVVIEYRRLLQTWSGSAWTSSLPGVMLRLQP